MNLDFIKIAEEGIRRIFFLIPSFPQIAQIEITNRCNFNCAMCQRFPLKVPIKDMPLATYKKIVDKLAGVEEVILTGWGEPLIHPHLFEMVKYAKDNGKRTSFTSNGSLLTENAAKKLLELKIDSISFSIDDIKAPRGSIVHPITTQIENIERFINMAKITKHRPIIVIQSTLHKGREKKIIEVIKWASQVHASLVNINRLDVRFHTFLKRPSLAEEKLFVGQIEAAGKKFNIRTEFRPYIAFSGVARIGYKLLAPFMGMGGQHCLRIYNYVYINMTGEITPCCALPLWSIGNILKEDLTKLWHNEKFNNFRQHNFQRHVCGKCDVLEVKQWG